MLVPVQVHADVEQRARVLHVLQERHGLLDLLAGAREQLGEVHRFAADILDLVEREALARRLDEVHHVVQPRDEAVDLFAVEGRDPGLVEREHDVVRDLVALVLEVRDLLREPAALVGRGAHLHEQVRGLVGALSVPAECVPEFFVPRARHGV